MTTSPPGHHREAKIVLTTTAKVQQLRANSREMTTFAESCNDREMQRPRSDKLETAQSLQLLYEILRRFMAVVISSASRKSLKKLPPQPKWFAWSWYTKAPLPPPPLAGHRSWQSAVLACCCLCKFACPEGSERRQPKQMATTQDQKLRNASPATEIQNPEPRNSSKKTLKKLHLWPRIPLKKLPNTENTWQEVFLGYF